MANQAGIVWTKTPTQAVNEAIDDLIARVRRVVEAVVLTRAPEIEAWMKANAPWTDRTGNARQTLHTEVITALQEVVLIMAHGMDYGIHLETNYGGVYAIVAPALDYWLPIILDDLRAVGLDVR